MWSGDDGNSPKEATDHMLEQSHRLLLNELSNHVAQDSPHRIEPFVGSANVRETDVIQQNLLHNEDGHRLAKLRASLHDAKTKRDDLGGEEEVDHIRRIVFDESANHAQRSQAQVFEGARLGSSVEKRVEEKRNVGFFHYKSVLHHPAILGVIITYRSRKECEYHCEKRHIATEPGHCRPGSRRQQSTEKGSAEDRRK